MEAEERRLFYVAITRAKDRLYLSRAGERMWRGELRTLPPSPFLSAIAPDLIDEQRPARRRVRADARQYSLF
jgi:superfamily I DNA/RNA helicase